MANANSKLYGVFYGKVVTDYDVPFPRAQDHEDTIANLTRPAQIEQFYPDI